MGRPINRIQPVGPAAAYRTFEIQAPESTHFRQATCAEVACEMQAAGFVSFIDESTDLGQQQAHYIRRLSGRAYTETREADGRTAFRFPAGSDCFREHRVRLDREEIFVVRGGDWRGNPTGEYRRHDRADHWQEDFAEHQDMVAAKAARG